MLDYIDYNKEIEDIKLSLHKPNKQKICNLSEAYGTNNNARLKDISELSFSLPFIYEEKENPHVEKIKPRYLIKTEKNENTRWYIITKINKSDDGNEMLLNISCKDLAFELRDKDITNYQVNSLTLKEVLLGGEDTEIYGDSERKVYKSGILSDTIWGVGFISPSIIKEASRRSLDISSKTVLETLNEISESFNIIMYFDTNNRLIDFYKPNEIGTDRGLVINYKKYLESIDKEEDTTDMVTRLKVIGKDGLTIAEYNPTGVDYVEDYSYFMYPFEMDNQGNILKHSEYMSDSLCIALTKYKEKINKHRGKFNYLLERRRVIDSQILINKKSELFILEAQLASTEENIYVASSAKKSIKILRNQKEQKIKEINNKKKEIRLIEVQIADINDEINIIVKDLDIENNLSSENIIELNPYIITQTISEENYYEAKDLYFYTLEKLDELKIPKINITIDMVNFETILEEQRNWGKLKLGDTISVKHSKLNINIKAAISEINYDYENKTVNIVITNFIDGNSDENMLIKEMHNSFTASKTLALEKFKWRDASNRIYDLMDDVVNIRDILTGGLKDIDILSTNKNDPSQFLIISNGELLKTKDGGKNFETPLYELVGRNEFEKVMADLGNNIESKFKQTAKDIQLSVSNLQDNTQSLIDIVSSEISLSVSDMANDLQAQINLQAGQIETKVSDGDLVSLINQRAGEIQLSAENIFLDGTVTLRSLLGEENGETVIDGGHIKTNSIEVGSINVTDLSAFNATVGGWIIGQDMLKSNGTISRIELNQTKSRISIIKDSLENVVMGYLEGLPKNNGAVGDLWTANNYGFWARNGEHLAIDGDVEYVNGDWLISGVDANIKINSFTGVEILRIGTKNGIKGLFINDNNGVQLASYTQSNILIGDKTGKYLEYMNGGLILKGNINMVGGTISWDNVTKPTYTPDEVGALPNTTHIPTESEITTITENSIRTATIEANQINVNNLSAISANLGSVTAGTFKTGTSGMTSDGVTNDSVYIWSGNTNKDIAPFKVLKNGVTYVRDLRDGLYLDREIYVTWTDGNNTTGDGTEAKPFKTLAKALDSLDTKKINSTVNISVYNTSSNNSELEEFNITGFSGSGKLNINCRHSLWNDDAVRFCKYNKAVIQNNDLEINIVAPNILDVAGGNNSIVCVFYNNNKSISIKCPKATSNLINQSTAHYVSTNTKLLTIEDFNIANKADISLYVARGNTISKNCKATTALAQWGICADMDSKVYVSGNQPKGTDMDILENGGQVLEYNDTILSSI